MGAHFVAGRKLTEIELMIDLKKLMGSMGPPMKPMSRNHITMPTIRSWQCPRRQQMFFQGEIQRNDYSTWIKNNASNMVVSDGYGRLTRGGQVPRHVLRSSILRGSTNSNESSARSNTTGSETTRTSPSRSCIEARHHGSSGTSSQQMSREKLHTVGHSNRL